MAFQPVGIVARLRVGIGQYDHEYGIALAPDVADSLRCRSGLDRPHAGLSATTAGATANSASAARFHTPVETITRAVNVHTTIVIDERSHAGHHRLADRLVVLAAEWAIGADPCPASLENRARLMPSRKRNRRCRR